MQLNQPTQASQIERWCLRLQEYDFKVVYRPGKTNLAGPPRKSTSKKQHGKLRWPLRQLLDKPPRIPSNERQRDSKSRITHQQPGLQNGQTIQNCCQWTVHHGPKYPSSWNWHCAPHHTQRLSNYVGPRRPLKTGDFMLVTPRHTNKYFTKFHGNPMKIVKIHGTQIIIEDGDGKQHRQNISHVKLFV